MVCIVKLFHVKMQNRFSPKLQKGLWTSMSLSSVILDPRSNNL